MAPKAGHRQGVSGASVPGGPLNPAGASPHRAGPLPLLKQPHGRPLPLTGTAVWAPASPKHPSPDSWGLQQPPSWRMRLQETSPHLRAHPGSRCKFPSALHSQPGTGPSAFPTPGLTGRVPRRPGRQDGHCPSGNTAMRSALSPSMGREAGAPHCQSSEETAGHPHRAIHG